MSRLALIWNESVQREEVLKIIDPVGRDDPAAVERFRREIPPGRRPEPAAAWCPSTAPAASTGTSTTRCPTFGAGACATASRRSGPAGATGYACSRRLRDRSTRCTPRSRSSSIATSSPRTCSSAAPELTDPWIADLGLARLIAETAEPALTGPGTECLGTPGYMAPEQIRDDAHAAGPAADIHALGAILYELLTGRPPFFDSSRIVALRRTQEQDPLRPSGLTTRHVPPDLEVIALKALQKDPAERFRTAEELADELDRWRPACRSSHGPPRPGPDPIDRCDDIRARRRLRRRRCWLCLASRSCRFALSGGTSQKRRADRTSRRVVRTLSGRPNRSPSRFAGDASPIQARHDQEDRAETLREIAQALDVRRRARTRATDRSSWGRTLNGLAAIDLALGEVGPAVECEPEGGACVRGTAPGLRVAPRAGLGPSSRPADCCSAMASSPRGRPAPRRPRRRCGPWSREHPDDAEARFRLARAEVNLGNFAAAIGRRLGHGQYRLALEQWEILCQPATVRPRYLEWYARTLSNLGLLMSEKGDPAGAVPILIDAVARAEQLAELVPGGEGRPGQPRRLPDQPGRGPDRRRAGRSEAIPS